jgi:hypothetical protein
MNFKTAHSLPDLFRRFAISEFGDQEVKMFPVHLQIAGVSLARVAL